MNERLMNKRRQRLLSTRRQFEALTRVRQVRAKTSDSSSAENSTVSSFDDYNLQNKKQIKTNFSSSQLNINLIQNNQQQHLIMQRLMESPSIFEDNYGEEKQTKHSNSRSSLSATSASKELQQDKATRTIMKATKFKENDEENVRGQYELLLSKTNHESILSSERNKLNISTMRGSMKSKFKSKRNTILPTKLIKNSIFCFGKDNPILFCRNAILIFATLFSLTFLLANQISFVQSGKQLNIHHYKDSGSAAERQLQLLRNVANIELNRNSTSARSQRIQRDTINNINIDSSSGKELLATCGYPGSPAHASVTFNTSHVVAGTAASYTCDNGYELLGPPRRICQANGTWSPVGIPFCVLNVGLGKAAMQSSTAGHGSAQKAVDGSTSPYFQASTCTMTDIEQSPWWYVNLLEPYLVQIVRIDFGTACCTNRQKATIAVRVGNNRPDLGNNPLCNRYHGFIEEGKPLFLPCTRPAPGAFVSIHLESPSGHALSICETFIYTDHALSIEQCPSFRDQPIGSTATYNGKCYLFHNNQALTFDNARKLCESRGGTLVDETSPALQGFLSWELYRRHRNDQMNGQYWLGAVRDSRNQQNWKWINGKDVQISFWNTIAGQGNCSRFDGSKGWLWTDADCSMQYNFICQYRPLSCGKPEKPTNSTLVTKNVDSGTIIEYQCLPGSLLMGPKSRTCLPTGFFSEFAPKCKYLDCQFPAMIANGGYKLLNGTTSYQSMVNYYCNDGYQLYNKSLLTCDVDERWNGPPPRCEPLLCSAPVPPSNGYVTVTSNITIPGTQATFDCRPGYELVGDRLLSCLNSGSWDFSFPYCRARLPPIHHLLGPHTPLIGGPTSLLSAATSSSSTTQRPNQLLNKTPPSLAVRQSSSSSSANTFSNGLGSVQFPPGQISPPSSSSFSSNRIVPQVTSSTTTSTTTNGIPILSSSTTTNSPPTPSSASSASNSATNNPTASLNGLAGQFVANQQQPTSTSSDSLPVLSTMSNQDQSNRKASSVNNQFVTSPISTAPTQQGINNNNNNNLNEQAVVASSTVSPLQQQNKFKVPSTSSSPNLSNGAVLNGISTNNQQSTGIGPIQPSSNNQQRQQPIGGLAQSSNNKFSFIGGQQQTTSASSAPYDASSAQLPTTNSISLHQQKQHPNSILTSLPSSTSTTTMASTQSTSGLPIQTTTSNQFLSSTTNHHHNQLLPATSNPNNNLNALGSSIKSHNTLANAKFGLDGIIAVVILACIFFAAAIFTTIVIALKRRKSGHSTSMDAQTISTYESNGAEHNGLYRNYQQAWENLRFATPCSKPKSSGSIGAILSPNGTTTTASVSGAALGLKNFNLPNGTGGGVPMLNHHLHHHHKHNNLTSSGGHHNLGMSHTGSSGSSSQSSSSLGGTGAVGGAIIDPLLRHQSSHNISNGTGAYGHHHHHHHHHQASGHGNNNYHLHHHNRRSQHLDRVSHHNELEEEAPSDTEQGVLSSDEAHYGHHHHHHHHAHGHGNGNEIGEGFRDTNELTINADTHILNNTNADQQQTAVARRRIYSTNGSIGRSIVGNVQNSNRISTNLSLGGAVDNNNHHHSHHHHHHANSTSSSQHQRLVSSSTPSTSTRSSRASPPSDDHSLDQLAYGNSWHQNSGIALSNNNNNSNNLNAQQQTDSSSSNGNNSAGSSASILGGGAGRANLRYN